MPGRRLQSSLTDAKMISTASWNFGSVLNESWYISCIASSSGMGVTIFSVGLGEGVDGERFCSAVAVLDFVAVDSGVIDLCSLDVQAPKSKLIHNKPNVRVRNFQRFMRLPLKNMSTINVSTDKYT